MQLVFQIIFAKLFNQKENVNLSQFLEQLQIGKNAWSLFSLYMYIGIYTIIIQSITVFFLLIFFFSFPLCLLCFITFSFIFFYIKEVKGRPTDATFCSCCKFCIYTHPVNSIFTTWEIYGLDLDSSIHILPVVIWLKYCMQIRRKTPCKINQSINHPIFWLCIKQILKWNWCKLYFPIISTPKLGFCNLLEYALYEL